MNQNLTKYFKKNINYYDKRVYYFLAKVGINFFFINLKELIYKNFFSVLVLLLVNIIIVGLNAKILYIKEIKVDTLFLSYSNVREIKF